MKKIVTFIIIMIHEQKTFLLWVEMLLFISSSHRSSKFVCPEFRSNHIQSIFLEHNKQGILCVYVKISNTFILKADV